MAHNGVKRQLLPTWKEVVPPTNPAQMLYVRSRLNVWTYGTNTNARKLQIVNHCCTLFEFFRRSCLPLRVVCTLEKFGRVYSGVGTEIAITLHTQNHNERTIKTNNRPFLIQIKLNKYQKTGVKKRKNHTEH